MNPDTHDPLARRLAELPEATLDARLSAAVRREARAALEETPVARLSRLWTAVMLPAVLVACAMVYAVGSAEFLERTYVATAGR